jgi:hypothetical protein
VNGAGHNDVAVPRRAVNGGDLINDAIAPIDASDLTDLLTRT